MKVLVVGSGAREHALAWRLRASPSVTELIAAPGNPGIAGIGKCFDVRADDLALLAELAGREKADLTVVGPEGPLAAGIVDLFRKKKLAVFGPAKKAAQLEASKSFAKRLMHRHRIPTAEFRVFDDAQKALAYVECITAPVVVKADGLAAGKGVTVCRDSQEAARAVGEAMVKKAFGEAGCRVVVEECLTGPELSVMAVTDGRRIFPLSPCRDYKRAADADRGPNTGGMGSVSPAPGVDEALLRRIEEEILVPVVHALGAQEAPFSGLLYAGLMLTPNGPKALEFNVRFGDPETQALLCRLKGDFGALLHSVALGRLDPGDVCFAEDAAVCVVACAAGYPGPARAGDAIEGLDEAAAQPSVQLFQAGTKLDEKGRAVTAGGRVLSVVATGADVEKARQYAYRAIGKIRFPGMHHRKDIGAR